VLRFEKRGDARGFSNFNNGTNERILNKLMKI